MKSRSVALVLLSCFSLSCSTTRTGRSGLHLIPESQMSAMGAEAFTEMKKKTPIESSPRINEYVRCVTEPLLEEAGTVEGVRRWEVIVFQDPTANAFALPGGKIGVHTGLLDVAKTPDQLAAVIGHEIGHVMAKHGNERLSQSVAYQAILAGTVISLGGEGMSQESKFIVAGLGLGAQIGILLPFSRTHESEADLIGLELMAKGGFNPDESVELWKNMSKKGSGEPPEFLSTHPSNSSRIAELSSHAPKWRATYREKIESGGGPECQY